jgi:formylglycine-generating enzyme
MTLTGEFKDMTWIPGGTFLMGCDDFYPEEGPVHEASVGGFWMDEHAVTVAEYWRFVRATGHVTVAERALDPAQYPGAEPGVLVPGSLVFDPPAGRVDLRDPRHWWSWVPGAQWRHPEGPGSTASGRDRHPVTQVAYEDAAAFAAWAGKDLPSEAEWERAARGGLEGATYAWGDEFSPRGKTMANTWHGRFPWEDLKDARHRGTVPVKRFPPNGYGLYEMTGNVWEWTSDLFRPRHRTPGPPAPGHPARGPGGGSPGCCGPGDPRAGTPGPGRVQPPPGGPIPRRVVKGGSYLCAPDYCLRYRPAARQGQAVETSSTHLGFRCVIRTS